MTLVDEHASAPASSVTPEVPAGFRLVPARIGRRDRKQIVQIPCADWCTEDHVGNFQYDLEDVSHLGAMFGVQVATMSDPDTAAHEWFARVAADPAASDPRMRAAHVLVGNGSALDAYLTPGMTDELADEVIEFGLKLRAAAAAAREANQRANSRAE